MVIYMIRLIQRRLIIPQGDTGTFTIPTQGEVETGDKAIFSILDNLTHKTVLEKIIDATPETLTFVFNSEDTLNLEPDDKGNRYSWDITLLRNPEYDEHNELIHADSIDSYYAAFGLPVCVIKRVTRNV
jgi:hypothetical protein